MGIKSILNSLIFKTTRYALRSVRYVLIIVRLMSIFVRINLKTDRTVLKPIRPTPFSPFTTLHANNYYFSVFVFFRPDLKTSLLHDSPNFVCNVSANVPLLIKRENLIYTANVPRQYHRIQFLLSSPSHLYPTDQNLHQQITYKLFAV